MAAQLAYLVEAALRLPLALLPGQGGGERVRTSKTAPLPLRLDPLSLTAGGHTEDELLASSAFVPVTTASGAREYRPAHDQGGQLPVQVWARAWASDWRDFFGHSLPPQVAPRRDGPEPVAPSRPALVRDLLGLNTSLQVVEGGEQDPSARAWSARFGEAAPHWSLRPDVAYLSTWLAEACERHPDIATFAHALRNLHAALKRTLGDGDDKTYLGRCPTGYTAGGVTVGRELLDRETREPAVCGTPLWHDPHVSIIGCPRCGIEYGPREHLRLAGWIRRAWPIDPRRRYTVFEADDIQKASAGEVSELRLPRCGQCGRLVRVEWKRATERGERESMWRIESVCCPAGCDVDGPVERRLSA